MTGCSVLYGFCGHRRHAESSPGFALVLKKCQDSRGADNCTQFQNEARHAVWLFLCANKAARTARRHVPHGIPAREPGGAAVRTSSALARRAGVRSGASAPGQS